MTRTIAEIIEPRGAAFLRLFPMILRALPERVANYKWHLVLFTGEGDMPAIVGRDMSDVIDTIDRDGVFDVTWQQLNLMAHELTQLFDVVIVALATETYVGSEALCDRDFEELAERCDLVIKAFDSYQWRVGGLDQDAVEKVGVAFKR